MKYCNQDQSLESAKEAVEVIGKLIEKSSAAMSLISIDGFEVPDHLLLLTNTVLFLFYLLIELFLLGRPVSRWQVDPTGIIPCPGGGWKILGFLEKQIWINKTLVPL